MEEATGARPSWTVHNVLAMMTRVEQIADGDWTTHLEVMEEGGHDDGDPFPEALAQWDRAFFAHWTDDRDQHLEPAAARLVELGNQHDSPSIRATGLLVSAWVATRDGDEDTAVGLLRQALGAAEAAHATLLVGQVRRELARLAKTGPDERATLDALSTVAATFAQTGNFSEQVQTAFHIVEHLVPLGELFASAVALELLGRTVISKSEPYRQLVSTVVAGLSGDEWVRARTRASAMQLEGLTPHLLAAVSRLTTGGPTTPGREPDDPGEPGEPGDSGDADDPDDRDRSGA